MSPKTKRKREGRGEEGKKKDPSAESIGKRSERCVESPRSARARSSSGPMRGGEDEGEGRTARDQRRPRRSDGRRSLLASDAINHLILSWLWQSDSARARTHARTLHVHARTRSRAQVRLMVVVVTAIVMRVHAGAHGPAGPTVIHNDARVARSCVHAGLAWQRGR